MLSTPAVQTTDAYLFTPGTTPPQTPPAYQGTFNGPGFLLGSTPVSSVTTVIPGGALVSGERKFLADIWGLRLGPYAEFSVLGRLELTLSGGVAAGVVSGTLEWQEAVSANGAAPVLSSGREQSSALVFGGYLGGQLAYPINTHWSIAGTVQYQNLGTYQSNFGFRSVEVNISKTVFVGAGLAYSF